MVGGYSFWSKRLGADPDAIRRSIILDGGATTVIRSCRRVSRSAADRGHGLLDADGQVAGDAAFAGDFEGGGASAARVGLAHPSAEMDVLARGLAQSYPATN